jgi:hypothetical protein
MPSAASHVGPGANASGTALYFLLASLDTVIPESSGCYGHYGQSGKPTVKDVLALELPYLRARKSVVEGSCKANKCIVTMNHGKGEDARTTSYEFRVVGGKLDARTLECALMM